MFLARRFYIVITIVILVVASGYLWYPAFIVGRWLLVAFMVAFGVDAALLYSRKGITAERQCSKRFSNGDDNEVRILVESSYRFPVALEVIDEMPVEFQRRDVCFRLSLPKGGRRQVDYRLRPVRRGVYAFGVVQVYASSRMGLVQRRFRCGQPEEVKVYPSFLMLRQYELLAIRHHLTEMGIKRVRRIGNNTEFEQIKDYVQGDDYRTINWRATARRHQLMVNVYQDERSQQIYNVIDKGRVMQQAFRGMTLLDYAINASLVLSYVAVRKEDKAGLATFAEHFDSFVPASRQQGQMQTLMEVLYGEQTTFGETDFSALLAYMNKYVSKRSLLVLYTNFMDQVSMRRQLQYLCQLNQRHLLLVVFFEDTELDDYIRQPVEDVEQQVQHVIAEKFVYEKRLIVSTLKQNGIAALLTTPENLSVNVINKYIELKQRYL